VLEVDADGWDVQGLPSHVSPAPVPPGRA
jgi:hypothetical protein